MGKWAQGKYTPKNPQKYKGDPTNIIYRSGWELKFMFYVDSHPEIIEWGSEEFFIPYRSPIDNRIHRYFPDFYIKKKSKNGVIETIVVEIKPLKQTMEPQRQQKKTKRYINEVMTWGINSSKWDAAKRFCEDRNWKFMILTEKELNIK
jgi:hypothetical protein